MTAVAVSAVSSEVAVPSVSSAVAVPAVPAVPAVVDEIGDLTAPSVVDEVADVTAPMRAVRAPLSVSEFAAWGRRLIQILFSQGLIELGEGPSIDEISYQLGGHLQAHGDAAEHSLETADWLVNELGSMRGIARLFATGGDLQLALRRSRSSE